MLIDVAYVGNHAVKQVLLADLTRRARTILERTRRSTTASRSGGFGSISAVLPAGNSNYHALQVKFERRFSSGLYVLNSFTWSKAIDNVARCSKSRAAIQARHRTSTTSLRIAVCPLTTSRSTTRPASFGNCLSGRARSLGQRPGGA